VSGKRKRSSSGYRQPQPRKPPTSAEAAQSERRGLLDGLFSPRVPGSSPMPRIRTTFARGFLLVASTPALAFGLPLAALAAWSALLSFGFQGPFSLLTALFAYPPVGTYADGVLSASVFGGTAGAQLAIFGFLIVRAAFMALIATTTIERLRSGRVTTWSLLRAARILPTTITVNVAGLALLIIGNIVGAFLGPGLGLLAFVSAMVAGMYLFAFAPAIAADEDRTMPAVMTRSVRGARMPGSGNLTLAVTATFGSWAILVSPIPGSQIGVNPSALAWGIVLFVNLLHVAVQATFAVRYLAVATEIPEMPAPRRTR
jgi:hypothetical protein